jgi:hypothetical protein
MCVETCIPECSEGEKCVKGECLEICDPVCDNDLLCVEGSCIECRDNNDCFYEKICVEKNCVEPECDLENPCEEGECEEGQCIISNQECQELWWYDNDSEECLLDEFCGEFMYEGLHTFETEDECNSELNN